MASPADLESWLRLALTPGVGPRAARSLLKTFGSPEAVCSASTAALENVVPRALASALRSGSNDEAIERNRAWAEARGNHVITLADEEYPSMLLEIGDPPVVLFAKGRRDLLAAPSIAIVGSRNATPQGVTTAKAFARALSDAGLVVVSGLALGIDTAAHEGGLEGTSGTIAVVSAQL